MALLLENPLLIYAVGAVLVTFTGLVFLARRTMPTLSLLAGTILLTVLLAVVELLVVTDAEQIKATTSALMLALEENDLQKLLSYVDPEATQVRADAEALMPLVKLKDTNAGSVIVSVDNSLSPPTAEGTFRAKVDGVHSRSGIRLFYFDKVSITWTKKGDRWLLTGYTAWYDGRRISPVESVRGNRPVTR